MRRDQRGPEPAEPSRSGRLRQHTVMILRPPDRADTAARARLDDIESAIDALSNQRVKVGSAVSEGRSTKVPGAFDEGTSVQSVVTSLRPVADALGAVRKSDLLVVDLSTLRVDDLDQMGIGMSAALVRRADMFLCSSEGDRDYWLGALAGFGRVDVSRYRYDRRLRMLIEVFPSGVSSVDPKCAFFRFLTCPSDWFNSRRAAPEAPTAKRRRRWSTRSSGLQYGR